MTDGGRPGLDVGEMYLILSEKDVVQTFFFFLFYLIRVIVCLSVCLVCLSVCLYFFHPSFIRLCVCWCFFLCVCLSHFFRVLFVCISTRVSLSVCRSMHVSVCLFPF